MEKGYLTDYKKVVCQVFLYVFIKKCTKISKNI